MDLKSYLDKTMAGDTKIARYEQFAKSLGVSVHTVYKWANGTRGIKDNYKLQIRKLTNGQVKLTDMMKG